MALSFDPAVEAIGLKDVIASQLRIRRYRPRTPDEIRDIREYTNPAFAEFLESFNNNEALPRTLDVIDTLSQPKRRIPTGVNEHRWQCYRNAMIQEALEFLRLPDPMPTPPEFTLSPEVLVDPFFREQDNCYHQQLAEIIARCNRPNMTAFHLVVWHTGLSIFNWCGPTLEPVCKTYDLLTTLSLHQMVPGQIDWRVLPRTLPNLLALQLKETNIRMLPDGPCFEKVGNLTLCDIPWLKDETPALQSWFPRLKVFSFIISGRERSFENDATQQYFWPTPQLVVKLLMQYPPDQLTRMVLRFKGKPLPKPLMNTRNHIDFTCFKGLIDLDIDRETLWNGDNGSSNEAADEGTILRQAAREDFLPRRIPRSLRYLQMDGVPDKYQWADLKWLAHRQRMDSVLMSISYCRAAEAVTKMVVPWKQNVSV